MARMETVARLSADDHDDVNEVVDRLRSALEGRFGVRTMVEASQYPTWIVYAEPRSGVDLRAMVEWAKGWLAERAPKKSARRLEAEIRENVAGKPSGARGPDPGRSPRPSSGGRAEYLRKIAVAAQFADDAWIRDGLDGMDAELKSLRRAGADPVIVGELERLYHRRILQASPTSDRERGR